MRHRAPRSLTRLFRPLLRLRAETAAAIAGRPRMRLGLALVVLVLVVPVVLVAATTFAPKTAERAEGSDVLADRLAATRTSRSDERVPVPFERAPAGSEGQIRSPQAAARTPGPAEPTTGTAVPKPPPESGLLPTAAAPARLPAAPSTPGVPTTSGTPAPGTPTAPAPTQAPPTPTPPTTVPTTTPTVPAGTPEDTTPPETTLVSAPTKPGDTDLEFAANEPATFVCSLDGSSFQPCSSPADVDDLDPGWHTVEVQATDLAGNADPSPVVWRWVSTGAG